MARTAFPIALALLPVVAGAHGLIEDPPARNWFCGLSTPPDVAARGGSEYPACREAFEGTGSEGYQFMSVLTHDRGRSAVSPLPANVCGFDSESFGFGATPWDRPVDWPTTGLQAGRNKFTWNISWGPHFSDSEEFRYWITKPDFDFQVGRALRWEDFESEPFCALEYDDAAPDANPDIVARPSEARFDTYCEVPQRSGRHVIYGEWGRNYFTFERFHGCVDVVMAAGGAEVPPTDAPDTGGPGTEEPGIDEPVDDGTDGGGSDDGGPLLDPAEAVLVTVPSVGEFTGEGSMRLDASGSGGDALSYRWSVEAEASSGASLQNADSADALLTLADPSAAARVTVTLRVQNALGSDTTSVSFDHVPADGTVWADLGRLTEERVRPAAGERVQLRLVGADGTDTYLPEPALVLDATTARASEWPRALAHAIQGNATAIAIGYLNLDDEVRPRSNATGNRVFARLPTSYVSAFVNFGAATGDPSEPSPPDVPDGPGEPDAPDVPAPPVAGGCTVTPREGANPWWAGFDIVTDAPQVTVDFSNTGIDLAAVFFDSGVFDASIDGQRVTLGVPGWVGADNPGYFGINANNVPALAGARPGCG